MKITFYGHASIGIEVGGKHILVDPFISANPLAENVDINTSGLYFTYMLTVITF
jgi:L-ascorbate metabolism protein UlaG (beta-lactamase superfamily)